MAVQKIEQSILLSETDAADLLGVSRTWLFTARKEGRLPYVKLGPKHIRYRRADLEAMLDGITTQASA